MKRFYLLLIMLVFLVTSCSATRYINYDDGYGTTSVSYSSSNYYTVMVYEGSVLMESYSPARIISRDGLVGGYTRVTLDVGGTLVTVMGSTILLYPVGYPDTLYLLYGTSYYRWHDRWNHFILSPRPPRPPRGHQPPPPPREPRRNEPRPQPNDRPQQGQPNVRPQGQPNAQPAPRPNNNQPNTRPNNNSQPNPRQNNNQPSARPNNQSGPTVTRPSTQSAPRGNSGGGGSRSAGPSNSGSSSSGRGGRGR